MSTRTRERQAIAARARLRILDIGHRTLEELMYPNHFRTSRYPVYSLPMACDSDGGTGTPTVGAGRGI